MDAGCQWVSGFWGEPQAVKPSICRRRRRRRWTAARRRPRRRTTSTYVPGCWVYQTNRYLWRPGYWVAYRPGWVWTPAYYRWTPSGYIYVSGYWDVPLLDRGLLFAPVRFSRSVLGAGFVYQPSYVIQPDFLAGALFVRTGRRLYYFGDYFEPRYREPSSRGSNYRVNRTVVRRQLQLLPGHLHRPSGLGAQPADALHGAVQRHGRPAAGDPGAADKGDQQHHRHEHNAVVPKNVAVTNFRT